VNLRPILAIGTLAAAFVTVTQPACQANLDTECVGGDGTCDVHDPTTASSGTGPGVGGGGGGTGGSAPACYEGCDTETASGNTGEYPCDVEAVIEICRGCHVPGGQGPFSLDTYEDSQQLFNGVAIWARLEGQLVDDFMPKGGPPLGTLDKRAILDDWACQCAPPRPAGETCD